MRSLVRKIFGSKILCFALLFIEFLAVVAIWAFISYSTINSISGENLDPSRQKVELIISIVFFSLRVILFVIDLIVFFKIINKDENPEYKIPWLACMFILPICTITFYLLFGYTGLRKKDKQIVEPTKAMLLGRKSVLDKENEDVLEKIEPTYRGVFQYLRNVTSLDVTDGNKLTYYKNGEEFFPEFVKSLKLAEKFIFIEFFIIGEGKWWSQVRQVLKEKAAAGVDVRVIYDDIGSSAVLPKDLDLQLQAEGIKCHKFHPVMPVLSNVVNNRDHRKIVVIDHKMGFTGGMNLADEYANDLVRFGYWKDTMVKVEGKGISNLIATFLQNYDLTTFKMSNYDEFLKGDYKVYKDKGFAFAFGDAPGAYQNYQQIGEQNYINLLNIAQKRVDICTPYLITSYPLQRAVLGAAKRGVEVNLIVPGIPDKKLVYTMAKCSFHTYLAAGVKIYTYTPGFNHEKQMLVDDRLCFVGTINFDFRSLTHHFETGITFLDAPCLTEIRKDFDEMLAQSALVSVDYKAKRLQRLLCAILKMFRVLF